MAAPIGNQNARKAKIWSDAIRKVLAQDKKRIERLAQALLNAAEAGDMQALKEFGDRMEGKPSQMIAGDPDAPLTINTIIRKIIDPQ